MPNAVHIDARGATDVGLVRPVNQDSFLVQPQKGLFIVADGMGGHAGGEIASNLCIEEVSQFIHIHLHESSNQTDGSQILRILENAINNASIKIYEQALEKHELRGMGTTATVLQIIANHAYIGHVGDSRLYLVRAGFIYQITADHSLVSEQVRAGKLTQEEADRHQLRNIITRSVGYQERELVDTFSFALEDQDIILMCSDGLHGKIQDRELTKIVQKNDVDAIHELIDLANERGGEDNITVIVAKIRAQG